MSKPNDVRNVYVAGKGEISFAIGTITVGDIKTPYILVSRLPVAKEIGHNLLNDDVVDFDTTMILFENIESLKVIEKCIKEVRENLTKKL